MLFLAYFERNALAARMEEREGPPAEDPAIGASLSAEQVERAMRVFQAVDVEDTGELSKEELADVLHGGDTQGWFARLDLNDNGTITQTEWIDLFVRILQTKGHDMCDFVLRHFERNARWYVDPNSPVVEPRQQEYESASPVGGMQALQDVPESQEDYTEEDAMLEDELGEEVVPMEPSPEVVQPERDLGEVFEEAMMKIRACAEVYTRSDHTHAYDGTDLGTALNLKRVFQELDTNGDGTLSEGELHHAFEELHVEVSDEQFFLIFDAFTHNGRTIDYGEFMYAFHNRRSITKSLRPPKQQPVARAASSPPSPKRSPATARRGPRTQHHVDFAVEEYQVAEPEADQFDEWGAEHVGYPDEDPDQREARIAQEQAELELRRKQAEMEKARRAHTLIEERNELLGLPE